MSGVSKLTADRNQRILLDLVSKPGNDICADCRAKAPRWASHNLGIFICMSCASIHRKIGTHITKVKSVTMDSWSREQVEVMKSIGNVASNAKYNPNEARHPPPANREESERDSELEKFIRWKYEFKRFMEKPGKTAQQSVRAPQTRAQSTPAVAMPRRSSPLPPIPTSTTRVSHNTATSHPPEPRPYSASATVAAPPAPLPSTAPPPAFSFSSPAVPRPVPPQPAPQHVSSHPVWNDMMSLAQPAPPMPPQSQLQPPQMQFHQTTFTPPRGPTNPFNMTSPTNPFPVGPSPSQSASTPTGMGTPFQAPSAQPQPTMGNPFAQQPSGFSGHMSMTGTAFHSPAAPTQIQSHSPFGQPSSSPFSHSYTPPTSFPQQQQQFAPSSFPQQFGQITPSHTPLQQPQQAFPQQPAMQGLNPFGPATQWQQPSSYNGQSQYGQWGGM